MAPRLGLGLGSVIPEHRSVVGFPRGFESHPCQHELFFALF